MTKHIEGERVAYDKYGVLRPLKNAEFVNSCLGYCHSCGELVERNGNSTSVPPNELKKGERLIDVIKHKVCPNT